VLLGLSALFLSPASAQATDAGGRVVTVAHRGASAYAPENTLAAVDMAADLGIAWVENDVQRTRDGELVVLHDRTLDRTTDVEEIFPDRAPWRVSDFTLEEIEQLDAGSWFGHEFAGEFVPTLREYLERVSLNGQNLLMELKAPELYPGIELQTLRELHREGWLSWYHVRHRLIIQSFSADSVRAVHTLRPDVTTGFIGSPAVSDLPAYAEFTDQINARHTRLAPEYLAAAHRLKGAHGRPLVVYTWTVDDGAEAVRLARMGVAGIITNAPDLVRDALREDEATRQRARAS
jgi:glycerophosphoryl diester phosphodiesterase